MIGNKFVSSFFIVCSLVCVKSSSFVPYSCPRDDFSSSVKFYLYSRNITGRIELFVNQSSVLQSSGFNKDLPTKFVTHGFLEDGGENSSYLIVKNAFTNYTDFNVITVDWSKVSGRLPSDYPFVVSCLRSVVAPYTASMVNFLYDSGVARKNFQLIGFSLGAQIMGIAANTIKFLIPRISGLDPAGPLFDLVATDSQKLDRWDAEIVDIIHTNSLAFGSSGLDGIFDFYINGGSIQPDCRDNLFSNYSLNAPLYLIDEVSSTLFKAVVFSLKTALCNHLRAVQVFATSINPKNEFPSTKCDLLLEARTNECNGVTGYAGYYLKNSVPGIYYTDTSQYTFDNLADAFL